MTDGFVVGGLIGLSVALLVAQVVTVVMLRRRHGGGLPLPAWLVTAPNASPELRALVAKMARSEARDVMAQWDTLPPGLRAPIRQEIGRMVAEAFAIHTGRRD